jgi:hypothetical protein
MRVLTPILALLLLALLPACSTPESRIADHRLAFEKYPADVQQKIRAGQVDVGFTQEMVQMALGKYDRRYTRNTTTGEVEVWSYHDNSPQFSFGIGVGSGGYHRGTAVGGGVAMSTGGYDPEEKIRVEFRAGVVTAVETIK